MCFFSGFGSVQNLPIQSKNLIKMGCEGVEHDAHFSPQDHPCVLLKPVCLNPSLTPLLTKII